MSVWPIVASRLAGGWRSRPQCEFGCLDPPERTSMSEASADRQHRTDRSAYAFWTRDTVRFSDIDRYRHINNVAVATYCETGRVEFAEKLWPGSTAGEGAG
jgi:hypothetical protein